MRMLLTFVCLLIGLQTLFHFNVIDGSVIGGEFGARNLLKPFLTVPFLRANKSLNYQLFLDKMVNWKSASARCRLRHGDLASVVNEFESELLRDLVQIAQTHQDNDNGFWIGLHKDQIKNQFFWTDASSASLSSSFTNYPWDSSAVVNALLANQNSEFCVVTGRQKSTYWIGSDCSTASFYICIMQGIPDSTYATSHLYKVVKSKNLNNNEMLQLRWNTVIGFTIVIALLVFIGSLQCYLLCYRLSNNYQREHHCHKSSLPLHQINNSSMKQSDTAGGFYEPVVQTDCPVEVANETANGCLFCYEEMKAAAKEKRTGGSSVQNNSVGSVFSSSSRSSGSAMGTSINTTDTYVSMQNGQLKEAPICHRNSHNRQVKSLSDVEAPY